MLGPEQFARILSPEDYWPIIRQVLSQTLSSVQRIRERAIGKYCASSEISRESIKSSETKDMPSIATDDSTLQGVARGRAQ